MAIFPKNSGWIELICGPMFSGKTEELIRRLVRAQFAKQEVAIFIKFLYPMKLTLRNYSL